MTQPAVLIRLRPLGPWRFGPGEGGEHRLDTLFRSDRLYSAVTLAMQQLGLLDDWLDATARAARPAVTFSSLFPFQSDVLFAPPPATLWPPPPALLTSPSPVFLAKMRWEAIRFIPLALAETLVTGQQVLADQWVIDAESGCLLRRDRPSQSPFRFSSRPRVPVDRITGVSRHAAASSCVEFESGSGLWMVLRFVNSAAADTWSPKLQAAFRLLADTGFGGNRSSGWGQTAEPEWQPGNWPALLFPKLARASGSEDSSLHWLLSLYLPSVADQVDWKTGDYRLTVRGGRVQSNAGSGSLKKTLRMVAEGSVLGASKSLVGTAVDVAPDGFAHPVYRAGFALALRLPVIRPTAPEPVVEDTPSESSLEAARETEALPAVSSDIEDEAQPATEPVSEAPIAVSGRGELEQPSINTHAESRLEAERQSEPEPPSNETSAREPETLPAVSSDIEDEAQPAAEPAVEPEAGAEVSPGESEKSPDEL